MQPDHSLVQKLASRASGMGRLQASSLVERLCDELRTWKYAARFGPTGLDKVGIDHAGNCIDLAALLCAALRLRGVSRSYVLLGSRLGEFPAALHAWVLVSAGSPDPWLFVDPAQFLPQPCDPRDVATQITLLAIFNDQDLVVGREDQTEFLTRAWQEGDDEMEQAPAREATSPARPVQNTPVAIEEQGEGFHAVLAGAAGNVLITNDLGRYVLERCDGSTTVAEIVAEFCAKYPDVPAARVTDDVNTFIETAISKGALTWQ